MGIGQPPCIVPAVSPKGPISTVAYQVQLVLVVFAVSTSPHHTKQIRVGWKPLLANKTQGLYFVCLKIFWT